LNTKTAALVRVTTFLSFPHKFNCKSFITVAPLSQRNNKIREFTRAQLQQSGYDLDICFIMNMKTSVVEQTDLAVAKAAILGPAMDSLGPMVVSFGVADNKSSENQNAEKESFAQPVVAPLRD